MATKGLEKLVLKKRVLSFGEFINSPKQFENGKAIATNNTVKSEAGDKDINHLEKATKSLSESIESLASDFSIEQMEAVIEAKKKDTGFAARMAAAKAAKAGKKPEAKEEKGKNPFAKKGVKEGKDSNLEADTKQFSDAKKASIPTKPTADAAKGGNAIQSKQGMATLPGKK